MNFSGISGIGHKGWPKREKIKGKCKQFSCTFLQWFFCISYFSHWENVPKIKGKIQVLQKIIKLFKGKLFALEIGKIGKNGIWLNFEQTFIFEDKGYSLQNLYEWKDLFKSFSKHPQLLSVGFIKPDWQLLKLIPYKSISKTHAVQPWLKTGFQFCAANRKEENNVNTNHRQALEKLI